MESFAHFSNTRAISLAEIKQCQNNRVTYLNNISSRILKYTGALFAFTFVASRGQPSKFWRQKWITAYGFGVGIGMSSRDL